MRLLCLLIPSSPVWRAVFWTALGIDVLVIVLAILPVLHQLQQRFL